MNAKIHRDCLLCGKNDVSSFLQKRELTLVRCNNCGMIYKQNPVLKPVKIIYRFAEKVLSGLNLAENLFVVLQKK